MTRIVKRGSGWRVGWDASAEVFKGLIGNDDWALELTEPEFNDFCRLLNQLTAAMVQMKSELMDEEAIACEAESSLIWLEAEGFPDHYSLRFIVLTGRSGEGFWPAESVPDLVQAVQSLKVF